MSDDGFIRGETGAQRLLGYVVDIRDPARPRCVLDVNDSHLNRHGALHGGIIAAALDNASGFAGSLTLDPAGRTPFTTVSLTVQFHAPGRIGRVTATAEVTGGGRSLLFIAGRLDHEDGTLIATSTGVFKKHAQRR